MVGIYYIWLKSFAIVFSAKKTHTHKNKNKNKQKSDSLIYFSSVYKQLK